MTWQIRSENQDKRVHWKMFRGERVERIQVYAIWATSMFQQNAIGTYARCRWGTRGFRWAGKLFSTWADLTDAINEQKTVLISKH